MHINDTVSVTFFIQQAVIRFVEGHAIDTPRNITELKSIVKAVAASKFAIDDITKNPEAFRRILGGTHFLIRRRRV